MHFKSSMGFGNRKRQRTPSPAPEVREFLDTEGGKFHKALGRQPGGPIRTASPPQPAENVEESPQLSSVFDTSSENLREALRQYQRLHCDPRLNLDIDTCTWEEVFQLMADAQGEYESKATKWSGCVHRLLRWAGDKADYTEQFIEFIPTEYGLGVLSAGISLIFMLAKTASQNRDAILAAFEEVPVIVASAEAKLKLQPENEVLRTSGTKLHLTVLVSITELVATLLPEKDARRVPYFWCKRKFSQTHIGDVLTRLRNDADELKRLVQDVLDKAVVETLNTVRTIVEQTTTIGTEQTKQTEILERILADGQKKTDILNKQTEHGALVERKLEESQRARKTMESMLQEVLTAQKRIDEENSYLKAQLSLQLSRKPVQGLMTIEQLLNAIGAVEHIEQSTLDVEKVLQLRTDVHPVAEAQTVSLLQTAVFRDWLRPNRSDVILIDGAGGAVEFIDHAERMSAKSILCALFLSQLTHYQPNCFRIFFFCGLHSSERDAWSDGPRGLMRSLLCDLVKEAYQRKLLNLDFIDDKRYRDALQQQNIEFLCRAFYQILQYMNMSAAVDLPIYCVIDGVAHYEKQEWLSDLEVVMRMFRVIVDDTKLKPCFKLLLTGPHRVRFIDKMLILPAGNRLTAKPAIMGENPAAQRELNSVAEQMLQARRQEMMAQRSGQSLYQDDQYSLDDYE